MSLEIIGLIQMIYPFLANWKQALVEKKMTKFRSSEKKCDCRNAKFLDVFLKHLFCMQ